MKSTEDAKVLAIVVAAPELGTPDDTDTFLNAMPVDELASLWAVLQRLSKRDQTSGAWAANSISIICRTQAGSCARSCARSAAQRIRQAHRHAAQ